MSDVENQMEKDRGENPDQTHDQDAEPPTPDGAEPRTEQLEPGSEPAGHPDPEPGG